MALNGGPHFTFSEAISLRVKCDTQEVRSAFGKSCPKRPEGPLWTVKG